MGALVEQLRFLLLWKEDKDGTHNPEKRPTEAKLLTALQEVSRSHAPHAGLCLSHGYQFWAEI